jgi:hypothetical protein
MYWLLLVPCVLIVWIVWTTFLSIILRPWLRLPLLPWSQKQWTVASQQLKPTSYVLLVGVFQWGWTCFFGITLFDYLGNRYFDEPVSKLSLPRILVSLLIWSLAGIGFGWGMRNSSQGIARHKKPDSLLR